MVDDLIVRKQEIVKYHTAKMAEINQKILDTLSTTLKDKNTDINMGLKFLDFFKGSGTFSNDSSIGMDSNARLELAKQFFENAKLMIEAQKTDQGYPSLLKDIETQMEFYRKELEAVDEELKHVEEEEKKKELLKKKDKLHAQPG